MSTFPIRCFTCNKALVLETYLKTLKKFQLAKVESPQDSALDACGHRRYCCRRMFLGWSPELQESLDLYSLPEMGYVPREVSSNLDCHQKG